MNFSGSAEGELVPAGSHPGGRPEGPNARTGVLYQQGTPGKAGGVCRGRLEVSKLVSLLTPSFTIFM